MLVFNTYIFVALQLSPLGVKHAISWNTSSLQFRTGCAVFEFKFFQGDCSGKRQVPVLVDGDIEIFDSTQIFEYFEPHPPLWPAEPAARARARLLELKSDEVFFPHVIRLMGLQDRLGAPMSDFIERAARSEAG
jgi:hypothetical protein